MADSGFRHIPPDQADTIPIETWEKQMGYVLTRLDTIEQAALKPEALAFAFQQAIIVAAANPESWAAAAAGFKKATESHAGKWLVRGLMGLLSKTAFILVIGMAIYSFGGWTALAKMWNVVTGNE